MPDATLASAPTLDGVTRRCHGKPLLAALAPSRHAFVALPPLPQAEAARQAVRHRTAALPPSRAPVRAAGEVSQPGPGRRSTADQAQIEEPRVHRDCRTDRDDSPHESPEAP